jgi:hypothetical protein
MRVEHSLQAYPTVGTAQVFMYVTSGGKGPRGSDPTAHPLNSVSPNGRCKENQ